MKSQKEDQKFTEGQSKSKKPRFKIEKLEERIAPLKGGIPGPPDCHDDAPNYPRGRCRSSR